LENFGAILTGSFTDSLSNPIEFHEKAAHLQIWRTVVRLTDDIHIHQSSSGSGFMKLRNKWPFFREAARESLQRHGSVMPTPGDSVWCLGQQHTDPDPVVGTPLLCFAHYCFHRLLLPPAVAACYYRLRMIPHVTAGVYTIFQIKQEEDQPALLQHTPFVPPACGLKIWLWCE